MFPMKTGSNQIEPLRIFQMQSKTFIAVLLGTTIVIAGGAVIAREAGYDRGAMFEELDADNDGLISEAEMSNMGARRMAKADTDGDGLLSLDELQSAARQRADRQAARMLERMDADNDGKLSAEEMASSGRHMQRFARLDTDGDGAISRAEFDEMHEKMHKGRRMHGHDDDHVHGHGHGHGQSGN
jgi:Ca2+-binding EF-hand superfamily protein